MGYDYTVIQVVCWVELLEKKETLPNFCENMDPNKWDTIVWYRVTRNPQEFRGLTGCQRDSRIWGVIAIGGTNEHSHDWRKCVIPLSKDDEAHQ